MKLQSTKTVRFEAKELRRLAKMTRPKKDFSITTMVLAGAAVGLVIVTLLRIAQWMR